MGDKKKKKEKDKKKDRKRDREEKKKRRKSRHSSDDSDDSSDDDSDSSVSEEKSRRKDKDKKKNIKKDKDKKKAASEKQTPAAPSNNPYNFDNISVLPVIKGIGVPVIPPPMPNPSSTSSVPKPKIKEPNIFKLLPKLPYGTVLFAKTIFSSEYLSEDVLNTLIQEMTKSVEQVVVQEGHKKSIATINKCKTQLQKIFNEEKEEREKRAANPSFEPIKEKSNRYQNLQKVFNQHMQKLKQ